MPFSLEISRVAGLRNRLSEWRERRNLTLEELADRVGVSHTTISRLESGAMQMTDKYLALLAPALDCHPAEIIMDLPEYASSAAEAEIIRLLRELRSQDTAMVLDLARRLKGQGG